MRPDRCITLCLSRLKACGFHSAKAHHCLSILMYHSVSNDSEKNVKPYYQLATTPQRFADQMRWLSECGYRGVSLEEALCFPETERQNRPVVAITFDDGFRDFHLNAWPVLKCHQFTATMYLPTAFIAAQRVSFKNRECLTWDEVRELRGEGIRFGSHTVSHPKLHTMDWRQIEREIAVSKQQIEHQLEEAVTSFAYPYAFPQEDRIFTQRLGRLLQEHGYRSCVTTAIGRAEASTDEFFLKRLPINSCDDRALFEAKLKGCYDWLGMAQCAYRRFRRIRRNQT